MAFKKAIVCSDPQKPVSPEAHLYYPRLRLGCASGAKCASGDTGFLGSDISPYHPGNHVITDNITQSISLSYYK